MGTGDRKKSGNLFTGSRLVVDGQGNSGVLRNKSNGFNNIFKTSNEGPGPALTPTQTPTSQPTPTPTPSITPTNTPTNTQTPTNTITPTQTKTPTPTNTQTQTQTNTQTPTNTITPTSWTFRRLVSCCGEANGKGYLPPNLKVGDIIVATNNLCYTVGPPDVDVATLVYQSTFIGDCTACNATHPC